MNKEISEQERETVVKFKESSLEIRLAGLLTLLSEYMDDPDKEKRHTIKIFIVNVLSLDEFLDFFLDNLATMNGIKNSIELIKEEFRKENKND